MPTLYNPEMGGQRHLCLAYSITFKLARIEWLLSNYFLEMIWPASVASISLPSETQVVPLGILYLMYLRGSLELLIFTRKIPICVSINGLFRQIISSFEGLLLNNFTKHLQLTFLSGCQFISQIKTYKVWLLKICSFCNWS